MAKHPEPFKPWLNKFPWMIDDQKVQTYALAWLFKEAGSWIKMPRYVKENWQYVNAILSCRSNLEFFVWLAMQVVFYQLVYGWYLAWYPLYLYLSICAFSIAPFAFFMQIRWTDKVYYYPKWIPKIGGKQIPQYLQTGGGWKQSGRFAVHFRPQTDASAQAGYHENMPNNGQAQGFDFGGK